MITHNQTFGFNFKLESMPFSIVQTTWVSF